MDQLVNEINENQNKKWKTKAKPEEKMKKKPEDPKSLKLEELAYKLAISQKQCIYTRSLYKTDKKGICFADPCRINKEESILLKQIQDLYLLSQQLFS